MTVDSDRRPQVGLLEQVRSAIDHGGMPISAEGAWLRDGLRLTKIRKLLVRQGVDLPYPFRKLLMGCGPRAVENENGVTSC